MIISDKQELRRCVKQIVRRADVCEASLGFDVLHGEMGVEAQLDLWARPALTPGESFARSTAEQTPFSQDAAAMFAALDAMDFPVKDLNRAKVMESEYERGAYLREVLDTLRAKCVLVRVPLHNAADARFDDDRFEPLIIADGDLFVPGRYGVDYAGAAQQLAQAAHSCGARNIAVDRVDPDALRYCLLPLCQDEGFALHVHLSCIEEIEQFALLLDSFDGVHVLASAPIEAEKHLITAAAKRVRMLVQLGDLEHLRFALERLGTRFVAYSAQAKLPEQMLGMWLLKKEQIWPILCDAYLPLARFGYELESAAIERDVRKLLSGNLLALCRQQTM